MKSLICVEPKLPILLEDFTHKMVPVNPQQKQVKMGTSGGYYLGLLKSFQKTRKLRGVDA